MEKQEERGGELSERLPGLFNLPHSAEALMHSMPLSSGSLHSAQSPLFLSPLLHISAVSNCSRRAGTDTNASQPVRTVIMSSATHSVKFSLLTSSTLHIFFLCVLLRFSCLKISFYFSPITLSPSSLHLLLPASFDYPVPFFMLDVSQKA